MLSLSLFGSPQILWNGQVISSLTSVKSQALLFYLALNQRPQSRLHLAGLLWPERSDREARRNLRQTLFLLRQALPDLVVATRDRIGLNQDLTLEIDIKDFDAEINAGLAGDVASLRSAVERYKGEFLAGFYVDYAPDYSEWVLIEQERLRMLVIQGLSQLSNYFVERGEIRSGILYTGKLLALEPWREDSYRQMMRLLARDGQIQAALAQYERCRQLLADELNAEPSAETNALYQQIQSGTFERFIHISPVGNPPSDSARVVAWGDAPAWIPMYGREIEMAKLEEELLEKQRRLVAVLGMGGQGKTTLASAFARSHISAFEVLLWRSLLNAPPLNDVLLNWLEHLAPESAASIPQDLDGILDLLFSELEKKRCLLVLDNMESIMEAGQHAGVFRAGYESYEQLLRRFALSDHQSCLLLTSREKPKQFSILERPHSPAYSLTLSGLEPAAGLAILKEVNLSGSIAEIEALVRRYSGNPLALILVADMIRDLYVGDVSAFLAIETPIFDNIQAVLVQQFDRLTKLEEQIMLWLAVEREVVDIPLLARLIRLPHTAADLAVALRSLRRRSLIEKRGSSFTLQNVLMEFTTDHLVAAMVKELIQGELEYFSQFPLLKAQARSYIRLAQERMLLQPVARGLAGHVGTSQTIGLLKSRLNSLALSDREDSYAGGNLLNLLLHLGVDEALDFSGTAVWQAYFRGKTLPPINLSGADLSGAAMTEYGGYVLTLVFKPDGTRLAGSTISGELRIWDTTTWQPVLTFDGHQDFAGALCFSPDGRFLVSGGGDSLACLWDVETGRRLHAFPALDNAVLSIVFAPDGGWIAATSENRLTVWDPVSGETLFNQEFAGGYVDALAVSHDGKILAFNNHKQVMLWDISRTLESGTGQRLHEFQDHQAPVRRLAFSSDNRWVAGSGDRVCVWEVGTGKRLHTFTVPNSRVDGLAFHPKTDILAGGSKDTIYLWSIKTGELLRAFAAHEETIVSLVFAPDGQTLASASEDHSIRLWNLNGQNLHTIQEYINMIHSVDVSPDGRYLASGSDDHEVRLWDFRSGKLLAVLDGHQSRVHRAVFSPDGDNLAASSRDEFVRVWAVPSGEEQYRLPTGGVPYHALAWSPDGRWLATGDRAGVLALWEAATGHRRGTFQHQSRASSIAFHPDGQQIAVGCPDQKIYIWEIETGRCIRTLSGHNNEVWALAYTQDGRFLISGSDDFTVRFWDSPSGECSHVLDDHTGWIQTLAVNHSQTLLATGSQDKSIRLWDVTTLVEGDPPPLVRTLTGHMARVTSVCFSPDGSIVASSSLDETMRLWDANTGECLQVWAIPGPYAGMEITGARGLNRAQRNGLIALGAFEKKHLNKNI